MFYEWMFRNKNYTMFSPGTPADYATTYATWDKDAIQSEMFGFVFSNEKVQEIELALIEADKLFLPIYTGFVDFEENYPAAVEALKAAGIDEYVAEVQRQLDIFLAQ
jgi:hypothetical protein